MYTTAAGWMQLILAYRMGDQGVRVGIKSVLGTAGVVRLLGDRICI